jgi:hypothetical protein
MKILAVAFALALALIGGVVAVSAVCITPAIACNSCN